MPLSTQAVDSPSTQTTQAMDAELFDIQGYSHVHHKHEMKKGHHLSYRHTNHTGHGH